MPTIKILLLPCQVYDTSNTDPPPIDPAPPANTGLLDQFSSLGGILDYWKDVTFGQYTFEVTVPGPGWVQVPFDLRDTDREHFFNACLDAAGQQFPLIPKNEFIRPTRPDNKPLAPADVNAGVVVFTDPPKDEWGEPGRAQFDAKSSFSEVCHEIGHLLGLSHSQGSSVPPRCDRNAVPPNTSPYFCQSFNWFQAEYGDMACIMSAMNVWLNSEGKGPTLCGPYLKLMGAIPDHRIVSMPPGLADWTQDLGPLRDAQSSLPQVLRFTTPLNPELEYFVEFRLPESWDDGLKIAGLFVYQAAVWRNDSTWRAVRLYRDGSNPDEDPAGLGLGPSEPPMTEGEAIADPVRAIRVEAIRIDTQNRVATVRIILGASPIPFEQRFRAVNTWAAKNAFIGGYPNFHQANYGPGWTFSTLLLDAQMCEWRDVSKDQLPDTATIEGRFRSLQDYAKNSSSPGSTFIGGFPTGLEADRDGQHYYGAVLIRAEHAEWRDIDSTEFDQSSDLSSEQLTTPSELLMKNVNKFALANGFNGGFPTYFSANRDGKTFFGAVLLRSPRPAGQPGAQDAIKSEDIEGSEVGYAFDLAGRLGSVQKHAADQGFLAGLPTFIDADKGLGTKFGTLLLSAEQADWRDIAATELGPVPSSDERFRALARWATKNQFVGGFPTFFEAVRDNGTVYGALLLKSLAAEGRDLLATQLAGFSNMAERMTAVNDWAVFFGQGLISGFPNYYDGVDESVRVIGIRREAAVFQDLPLPAGLNFEDRYRAANKAATDLQMGYSGAFLTGFQADYGNGIVYGCILLKEGPTVWRDIPATDLNLGAGATQDLFQAVDAWARLRGFVSGVPTLFYAGDGGARVYGAILLSPQAATPNYISPAALGDVSDIEAYFRTVNFWATRNQFIGAYATFSFDNQGPVHGAVLINDDFAEWKDIPMSALVFP